MNPFLLLRGDSPGKTIYNVLVAVAFAGVLLWVSFALITGKFWRWQSHRQEARAERAEQNAAIATGNAKSSDAGAANATLTRAAIGDGVITIRLKTDQAATRLESNDEIPDDSGALPADLVRELDAARSSAGAAAHRLQRKGPR